MGKQNQPKLLVSKEYAVTKIERQLEIGRWLRTDRTIDSDEELDKLRLEANNWSRYNLDLLARLFDNPDIVGYINFYHQFCTEPYYAAYQSDMGESISSLEGIRDQLELFDEHSDISRRTPNNKVSDNPVCNLGDDVFIVHGHDEVARLAMVNFVKTFDLNPIILDEKANEGHTIIEKFEAHAREAGYAIILLTPDDVGARKDDKEQTKPRARQNVILELGYFMGKLGRERVCVLHKEEVELPSDIYGIVYVPMDSSDGWQLKLAKEMNHAGLPIDPNDLL